MARPTAAALVLACLVLGAPPSARSRVVPEAHGEAKGRIAAALRLIRRSVDPCGESADVTAILDRLASCEGTTYEIRPSATTDRNLFERHTITWNPDLRSELEPGPDGRAVWRDPVASLLHELVHAAHQCAGLDPGAHELEAVRIENIYRRAAGLTQRTRYGDDPIPSAAIRLCGPERCSCSRPRLVGNRAPLPHALAAGEQAADSAPASAEPVR